MMVEWKLWLDDQTWDPEIPKRHAPDDYIGAASSLEAKKLVEMLGPPMFMSLDFDLGGDDTARNFLNWLFYEYGSPIPPEYEIHSENIEGQKDILSFMESWKKSLDL